MRKILLFIVPLLFCVFSINAQSTNADENAAMSLVSASKAKLGLSAEDLANVMVSRTYQDNASGIRMVYLNQTYKGIPVFTQMLVLAFKGDKLVSQQGTFNHSLDKFAANKSAMPAVTAQSAVQSALSDRGLYASQMAVIVNSKDNGKKVEFSNMGVSRENITAQLMWTPVDNSNEVNLSWHVYIIPKTTADYWMVRVDAANNSILGMDNYTDYCNWGTPDLSGATKYPGFTYGQKHDHSSCDKAFDFNKADGPSLVTTASYRVVPFPAEAPSFSNGAHAIRTDPWTAAPGNATSLRWHTGLAAADYSHTRSNNVFAYQDRSNDNVGTIADAVTSSTAFPNLTFDHTPDYTVDPTQTTPVPNQQFNTVNLFYWNNIIHDVMYIYGFTEPAANFQDDNLSRGGLGNDHVNAEAQDGGGTNNANFSTPADGTSGRMQMYLWTGGTPNRDGDVDNGIVVHEYGHGISNRLTGGGSGACLGNAEQMGEGWSDYYALMFTQNWATATVTTGFNSPRGIGTYAIFQPPTGLGIRGQRYCTDFTVNNRVYLANLPAGPHPRGEIWCATLWDMTWNIINQVNNINPNLYDLAGGGGNTIAMRLVTEGLRLQQCSPGFISGRNAILAADQALYGGTYSCTIWESFRRRGMGAFASEGSTGSVTDQIPDFTPPITLGATVSATTIPQGSNLTYTNSLTTCSAVSGYTLRDTLPTNVTYVSGGTYDAPNRVVSFAVNQGAGTTNYPFIVNVNAGSYFAPVTLFTEPVATATIPATWTTAAPAGNPWTVSTTVSNSAPNSFYVENLAIPGDQRLTRVATFALPLNSYPELSFWHRWNTEDGWDGGVVEISTNGGTTWNEVPASYFTLNGYNGALGAAPTNALSGRAAFTGLQATFINSKLNLAAFNGQTIQLRFRFGSDDNTTAPTAPAGWWVDDITLSYKAAVNMRSSLFNTSNARVSFKDNITEITNVVATNPNVTINQAAAQADPTGALPINFTVVFDQAVIGFATGDVTISGTATGTPVATVTGGPTTYNVAVSGLTSCGTVIATIAAGVCTNAALDPNNASTSTDNTVTYTGGTPPAVTINQAATQVDPATTLPINFTAVFNQAVTGFTAADVTISGTAPGTPGITITGGPSTYNIAVNGFTGSGTVIATIPAGGAQNACAQTNTASTSTDNTVTYNAPATPPTVTINQAAAQPDPTSVLPINFTVVFDQPVTGFATGDVTISGTASGTPVATVTGGPTTYNVSVNGLTGSGTVIASIAAGVCQNAAAQPNVASTSTDNTVTYNAPAICTNVNQVPNQTVCHLSPTAAVNFTSGTPGTTFSWVNNNTSIGLAASGSGPTIASFIATNPTTAPVTATITVTPTLTTVTATTTTFNFTGGAQTFTVPAGVSSINITTLGAQGGTGATGGNGATGGPGGLGSRATGTLAVTPGQVLTIFVGGQGGVPTSGFNGGGTGGNANSGGGGGGSDVRFPGATSADRILVAGGGGGGGRAGCEPNTVNGGAGGNGDGNGANGVTSPNGGGGFGAIGTTPGAAGIGCAGFLGSPGLGGFGPSGGNGGAGQSCCCFTFASVPGGGGGGGGFLGGAGGGGGSAGTTGCLGNDKGGGGGGAGGTSSTSGVTAGVITTGIQTGNGQVVLNYNVTVVCTGPTMAFTITVNPTPAVDPIPNQVVCQNAPTAPVNFTGTPVGVVFQWTNNTPAIGLAASGTGNIPSFIAQNPTALPLVATITVTPVTGLATPIVTTYNFTGAVQTFTVPAGITSVNLKSWGAQGNSNAGGIVGGRGGYAEGNLTVVPGQVLNVYVGGGATTSINGGYNGGGNAGTNAGCAAAIGGGGGGASDVRIAPYALANRVIVGAGGGGAGGNRTAGCGRGTGGGGGGGLWGGGGGAGWPGVPPGGPVPTGGTQVAGGAAGVTTWTGGGPTNGFPGVLAVGGAGGIEVGSAQGTPTGPAEQGGVGGGLTGGAGLYNSANNWNGHSGAGGSSYIGGVSGGITTAGLRTGAGQVQVTYTPISAATCFGVARSFTITVNPNANLIIVADPGTTICEGDPTLLTVFDAGAVTAPGVLYTQGTTPVNGSPSQVFEPANAAFTSQGADNFTIPSGGLWNITQITANGIGAGVPTSVNVFFYANSGSNLPGAAIASMMNITTFVKVGGNYTVTLPSAVALGGGTYWMSFQVNMSFAAGGQWFWGNFGAANINQEYAWQNPGGGFATPCTAWGYGGTGCNVGGGPANRNNIFSIIGTSVGLGPQSTGTFLWSPALGLSSTTSNPVAASPMNTTTYTVVRTTVPGGCQASAMVTITVNKRPVVTAQPVNIVRCVGNTATFTVGGTGTGLTYQWQLNTAGCGGGGTWTNLTNLAPYSGVTTATLTVNPVSGTMSGYGYRCVLSGTCTPFIPPTNVSNCATLTVNPNPNIAITPVGPVCGGVMGLFGTALNVTSAAPPVPGNASANSGVIAVPIPDGSNVAATSNLTIAGIPANATLGEIRVNMNINHTWVGDVDVSLRAPNLAILNLVGSLNGGTGGNAGDNFTNTTFSSLGGTPISGAPDPRTGTFAAEARVGFGPIGFIQAAAATWANLAPPATPLAANGVWTLAAGDKVLTDVGTITNWSISIDYTTPGSGTQVLTYAWSPLAGLYTNTIANIPYAGTNLTTVYAAPTVQTTYTVRATDVATGCFSDASVLVNYTPPPPTITPSSVTMCLGDPAVRLVASSSTPGSATFSSGTVNVAIPDGPTIPPVPTSYPASVSNITVAGIPAGATITAVRARFNVTHAWVSDLVIALKAPNGQIVNLSALLNRTNQPGANFTNTVISSTSTTALGGAAPYTGTFADDAAGATFTALGFTFPGGPVGYVPTTVQYADLYNTGTTNGVWSLGIYDAGAPDAGTLNNWSLDIDYVVGVVASGAIWTPNGVGSGLFNDAAASSAYIGDRRDTVWARPTPIGANPYQVTVNNMISFAATPATPMAGGNGNNLISFNVRNNNAFPVTLAGISSNAFGSGAVAVRSFYKVTGNAGNPGPITAANGFVQFGTSNVTVTANTLNPVLTGLTLTIPAGATYAIALDYTGATFPAYTNGAATTVTYTNNGCDIITGGNVGWGGPAAPGTPVNNPRNFNGTVTFLVSGPGTCVSPPRTVIVTVNQPTVINANIPVNQTICTDKVATFSAAVVSGTGPHSYQWQVSTNSGVSFANVANGGVYSGATTATLTITAPPVSMSNYQYRCIITGAAPCAAQTSRVATLVVNPLPVIVISATAPRSLFPGLRSTFTSTVTPNPAGPGGYSWIRNGVVLSNPSPGVVSGLGTGSIIVDVDGQGDYQLRVTDVNGCTNISNTVTIKDSLNGKCFIYPNPTSGKFQVRYHSVANNVLPRTLTINDAKGDRVFTQRYTIGFPYDRMEVDLRGFGKGMYWVEIGDLNGNRLAMCRVVVQ